MANNPPFKKNSLFLATFMICAWLVLVFVITDMIRWSILRKRGFHGAHFNCHIHKNLLGFASAAAVNKDQWPQSMHRSIQVNWSSCITLAIELRSTISRSFILFVVRHSKMCLVYIISLVLYNQLARLISTLKLLD